MFTNFPITIAGQGLVIGCIPVLNLNGFYSDRRVKANAGIVNQQNRLSRVASVLVKTCRSGRTRFSIQILRPPGLSSQAPKFEANGNTKARLHFIEGIVPQFYVFRV